MASRLEGELEQLFADDVLAGQELGTMRRALSTRQFVQWACADHDWNQLHYDHLYATRERGLPGVAGPGGLTIAFLAQILTDWAGPRARVLRVRGEYRGLVFATDVLTCGGRVVSKEGQPGGEGAIIECELWCENEAGKRVTSGRGTVWLPSRAATT